MCRERVEEFRELSSVRQAGESNMLLVSTASPDALLAYCDEIGFKGPVVSDKSSEVYDFLKVSSGNTKPIEWNFGKFLVGKDGTVIKRYPPNIRPSLIKPDIVEALAVPRR